MIVKPISKINLGLNVVRKRADGYHDLETVFYPVGLSDRLELNESEGGRIEFHSTGIRIPGDASTNLCVKAWRLMNEHFGIPPVRIDLEKIIPMGSGLGGGSSDGTFTLIALNQMFSLNLTAAQLRAFASQVGSDCAFFVSSLPAFAKGRGEILEPIQINLAGYFILIVVPPVHISTTDAYAMISPGHPAIGLKEIVKLPPEQWKGKMINDFEIPISKKYQVIQQTVSEMYSIGAVYVSMSGSGSSVYGIFREQPICEGHFSGCFIWQSEKLT
jgi:4-diphosphocytidyl-2-C-methyl-D-erythritol kinase